MSAPNRVRGKEECENRECKAKTRVYLSTDKNK